MKEGTKRRGERGEKEKGAPNQCAAPETMPAEGRLKTVGRMADGR